MIGCGILHKEDDWDIYRLPNGRLTVRHYHKPLLIRDSITTTEPDEGYWSKIHVGHTGCWYCEKPIPEKMLLIYKILSMGQAPGGPADVVC
jgi:hypothetical protein